MATALRFRLFRSGKFPDGWADAAGAPDVLLAREGVPVRSTSESAKLPGRNTNSGVRKLVGSLIITPERIRASLGNLVLADSVLDGTATADSVVALHVEPAGVRVHVDISRLVPGGRGVTDFRFDCALDEGLLGRLVHRSCELHPNAVTAQRLSRRV